MNPDDLGDLAESMVPIAARLAAAVRDNGPGEIGRLLDTVRPEDLPALIVVLAAMVDPARTPAQLLAWVTWDAASALPAARGLFDAEYDDPASWSDRRCKRASLDYRKRMGGNPDPDTDPVEERRGHLEWDRRRKARARAAETNRIDSPESTRVNSTA